MSLIPMMLLTIINHLIYKKIHRFFDIIFPSVLLENFCRATVLHNSVSSHHRRDSTMVALLSSIVIVFLLCHSTKLITNIYEAYQMIRYGRLIAWPLWADILSKLNHFMLAVNSSINIIIYVIKVVAKQLPSTH